MDSPPDGSVPSAPRKRGTEGDSAVIGDGNNARQAILI
jgi:hypothetical protein